MTNALSLCTVFPNVIGLIFPLDWILPSVGLVYKDPLTKALTTI